MRAFKKFYYVLILSSILLINFVYAQIPPDGGPGEAGPIGVIKQVLDIPGKQEGPISVYGRYTVYMQDGNVWLHDAGDLYSKSDDRAPIQITKDGIGNKYTFPIIDKGRGNKV